MSQPAAPANSNWIVDQPAIQSGSNGCGSLNNHVLDPETNSMFINFELEMAQLEAAKKEQQRENEINSAIRSLSTNLIISFVFFGFTFLWPFFSELFVVTTLAMLKVLIPVIATVSNFVIIQNVLLESFQNCLKTIIHW